MKEGMGNTEEREEQKRKVRERGGEGQAQAVRARQTLVRVTQLLHKKEYMMTGFAIFFGTWRSALVEYVANEERKDNLYLRSGRVDCVSVPWTLSIPDVVDVDLRLRTV